MGKWLEWILAELASCDLGLLTEIWVSVELWIALVFLVVCHHGILGTLIQCLVGYKKFFDSRTPQVVHTNANGRIFIQSFLGFGLLPRVFAQAKIRWTECLIELQGKRKSTYRISSALVWDELQYSVALVRLAKFIPPMLIGIGILGTFVGLTAGIANVQLGDEQKLVQNVSSVLNGMQLAFITSIFGIGLSLVWNLSHRAVMGITRSAVVILGRKLDKKYETWSDDDLNKALVADQLQQTATLKTMSSDLATQLTEGMRKTLDAGLVAPLGNFINRAEDMSLAMAEEQQAQTKAIEKMAGDLSVELSEGMERALDKGLAQPMDTFLSRMESLQKDSLSSIASGVTDSISKVVGSEFDSLKLVLEDLIELHDKSATHLQTTVDVLQRSGESHQALLDKLERATNRTDSYINSMQNLQVLIEDAGKGMQATAQAVAKASDSSANASAIQRELMELVSKELADAQQTWRDTEKSLKKLSGDLNSVVGTFKENIKTTIEQSHSQFDQLMSKAITRLSGTVNEMTDGSEEITTAILQLTKHSKGLSQELLKQQGIYTKAGGSIERISRQIEISLNNLNNGQEQAQ